MPSPLETIHKDPDAVLDYDMNWADWLADGETISTSVWSVDTGLTQDSESETNTVATVWLSSGTADTKYRVRNRITTSASRTEDRSFYVYVVER